MRPHPPWTKITAGLTSFIILLNRRRKRSSLRPRYTADLVRLECWKEVAEGKRSVQPRVPQRARTSWQNHTRARTPSTFGASARSFRSIFAMNASLSLMLRHRLPKIIIRRRRGRRLRQRRYDPHHLVACAASASTAVPHKQFPRCAFRTKTNSLHYYQPVHRSSVRPSVRPSVVPSFVHFIHIHFIHIKSL